MKTPKRFIFSLVTILVFLIHLMSPILVQADGETPPAPTETAEVTSTPDPTETAIPVTETSTPVPTDAPDVISTPLPNEATVDSVETVASEVMATVTPMDSATQIVASESSVPTDLTSPTVDPAETVYPDSAMAESPAAEELTLVEVLQEIPIDTSVIVLDENGEALSLVTQEAADAIVTGDPVWCPDGVAPTPMANGCTPSYATMDALITAQGANINSQNVNGTIWITSGPIGDVSTIDIPGGVFFKWAIYSLTLQGGWSGISGDTSIGANSTFSVPIIVSYWRNNITINNITIANASSDGLYIHSFTGDATINNSTFDNNQNLGVGTDLVGGNLTVNNSTITGNTGTGASLYANNITINDSTINGNTGWGANLYANNLAINNSNINGNGGVGAGWDVADTVSITNSTFIGNGSNGAQSNNSSRPNNLTIDNSTFSGNGWTGGLVVDVANITIYNSTFTGNTGNTGAYIIADSDVIISNSIFSGNTFTGANISASNNVTISNSTFNNTNRGNGANIDGSNINIMGSTFSNNAWNGADISASNATIANSTFSNNVLVGLNNAIQYTTLICNLFQNNGQDQYINYPNSTIVDIPCTATAATATPTALPALAGSVINVSPDQDNIEVPIGCDQFGNFLVAWGTGDQIQISCLDGGVARITRVDNTALNPDLPAGYEYVTAYNVEIFQSGISIPLMPAGGFIQPMLASRHDNPNYGIMVWDAQNNKWTLLNQYQQDQYGASVVFPFDPSDPQDEQKILQGTRLVTNQSPNREQVRTNFPGIFVLVQQ